MTRLIKPTSGKPILDIENDLNGNLWYISENKIFKYNKSNKITKQITITPNTYPARITVSSNGTVWVSSKTGLYSFIDAGDSFIYHKLDPILDNDFPFFITKIFSLNKTSLAIGTASHGSFIYDIPNKSLLKIQATIDEQIFVRDFLKSNNDLWIASESGIYIYNLISKRIKTIRKEFNNPYALSDNAIYSLVKDNAGGIWVGTYFGGINYLSDGFNLIKKYYPITNKNSINGQAVREICEDSNGDLWIGTEDAGLNKLNLKTGVFQSYRLGIKIKEQIRGNIHGLLPLKNVIWVGTFKNGLYVLDIETGKTIKHFKAGQDSGLKTSFIVKLFESSKGKIYALTDSGVYTYNSKTDRFKLYNGFPSTHFYNCIMEDHTGGLWAGTYWDGLYFSNPETHEKTVFKKNKYDSNSLSSNAINGIFVSSKTKIWITTENGLNLLNTEENTFQKFTVKDDFPSNAFYTILEDNEKQLWITTAHGLVLYDPENKTTKTYTVENGLLSNQFNYCSAFKSLDNTLYFGSVKGMISFNPGDMASYSQASNIPIVLTGIKIKNKDQLVGHDSSPLSESITVTDVLDLSHNQSSFSIQFAALNFKTPNLIKYAYKLNAHDPWLEIEHNTEIFFSDLASGNYTFMLKHTDDDGRWSDGHKMLDIHISPPYWASKLAYLIYISLVILVSFIIIRRYHLYVEAKNAKIIEQFNNLKETEIFKSKIEFFTNISHEILTPLTLIKSPLEKLVKSSNINGDVKNNLSIMYKNTTRLHDLVEQLLDFRKTEMERLSLTFVNTNITMIVTSMYQRFGPHIIDKEVEVSHNLIDTETYAFVDVEALKKIISNLLKNAIKYSHKKIEICLKENKDYFELIIRNDGKLVPPHLRERVFEPFYRLPEDMEKPGTGIGLSLAYSLTELHKGNLRMDMDDVTMNSFVLKLPIHQEKEFNMYPSNKWVIENGKNLHKKSNEIPDHKSAILLVEDSEDLLDFIANDLITDYLILKATNAVDALKIIEEESLQLIISDIMMPGINGFEFCKKVKNNIKTSHIPIIFLTSKSAINDKIGGLEVGADAYITKPFSMDYLKSQVNNLLKNRRSMIDHYSSSPLAHVLSIAHSETDEVFIKKLDTTIQEHLSNCNLTVETLAEIMSMSRSTLYRKIKDMTNLSPNEFINIARLKKAAELLKTDKYKIYEVSEMVGYNSGISFGRNFQKQFKMTPSEYIKNKFT